jgi:hypothetical protein
VATVPYKFEQCTGFPIQPEVAANTAYVLGSENFANQSHLKATAGAAVEEMKFLAVLIPYRSSESRPEVATIHSGNTIGFRVAGTEILAWWGSGRQGNISTSNGDSIGRLYLKTTENGKPTTVVTQ